MIIVRYTEIGIKGKNRSDFEKRLQLNIKSCLKKNKIAFEKVVRARGRILVETEARVEQLTYVYGISSYSYCRVVDLDFEEIKKVAKEKYTGGTFRVTSKRLTKELMSSPDIEREVGAYIVEQTGAKVKLVHPDCTITIEILDGKAYIFSETIRGPGGLPIGVEGRVTLVIENEDSIKAGILVMKRGCMVDVLRKNKSISYDRLKEYEYGFTIKEVEEIPEDTSAVIVSDTVETIKSYPYFVLRPLV